MMLNNLELGEEDFLEYVIMPWDDKTEIIAETDSAFHNVMTRWNFIQIQLSQNKPILNASQLVDIIKSYNLIKDSNGKQLKPPWKFTALLQYFQKLSEKEKNEFFKENGTLEMIRKLSLQAIKLVPKVKLLKSGFKSCVTLHQFQIASLLANAFLCTYPKQDANYPSINFNRLFEGSDTGNMQPIIEKIKCIVHYFKRINEKQPIGNVSFQRLCILDHKFPRWDKTTVGLCDLKVEAQGKIEDQEGYLQMDFANRFVGGGVLGMGCVQEEIRFIISPELIAARLFTQCLADNEALFVAGAERYCNYTGYADTFEFDGDYRDNTAFDETNHRKTYLIVLDALYFNCSSEQYRESKILRELKKSRCSINTGPAPKVTGAGFSGVNPRDCHCIRVFYVKAYVGFRPLAQTGALPLATGNWGCGAFRGDPQLKSILQLMASSQARRNILYLTFGDFSLKNQIDDLYKLLKECDINVGTLYRIIRLYNRNRCKNQTLFGFIRDTICNYKKRTPTENSSGSNFLQKKWNETGKAPNPIVDNPKGNVSFRKSPVIEADDESVEKKTKKLPANHGNQLGDGKSRRTNWDESLDGFTLVSGTGKNVAGSQFQTAFNVGGQPRGEAKKVSDRSHKDFVIDIEGSWEAQSGEACGMGRPSASFAALDEEENAPETPLSPSLLSDVEEAFKIRSPRNFADDKCEDKAPETREASADEARAESGEAVERSRPCAAGKGEKASNRLVIGQSHKMCENPETEIKAKARKLIQPKITDCFFRK